MNKNDNISCIIENDCEECRISVGTGQLLSICNSLRYKDCGIMYDKIMSEEMSAEELIDTMKDRTKNTNEYEIVVEIQELMSLPVRKLR